MDKIFKIKLVSCKYSPQNISCKNQIEVGSARTARRFIYVKDVASAIYKSTKSSKTGTYNLSGDKLVSLKEIINISGKIVGRKIKIIEK